MKVAMTSSSAGAKGAGWDGGATPAFFLGVLQHVDQHLGRVQIGCSRFVDQLCHGRLTLSELALLAV